MKSRKFLLSVLTIMGLLTAGLASAQTASPSNIHSLVNNSQGLRPSVLKVALDGYQWAIAHGQVRNKRLITIIDLSLASNQKRMWVVDLKSSRILMALHVAHGKNSGVLNAQRFSNKNGSMQSSVGVFRTLDTYVGKHGLALRIDGLERGINDQALSRAIVVHAASYMTPEYIRSHGRAGLSWGCPAVDPHVSGKLINLIKGGSVMFTYGSSVKKHYLG